MQTGQLSCIARDGKEVNVLTAGAVFGELAALGLNIERSLTVVAKCASVLYQLDADAFEIAFSEMPDVYSAVCQGMRERAVKMYHDKDALELTLRFREQRRLDTFGFVAAADTEVERRGWIPEMIVSSVSQAIPI